MVIIISKREIYQLKLELKDSKSTHIVQIIITIKQVDLDKKGNLKNKKGRVDKVMKT